MLIILKNNHLWKYYADYLDYFDGVLISIVYYHQNNNVLIYFTHKS